MSKEDQFLRIGKIIGAHGLHGRLKIFTVTDFEERFDNDNPVFLKIKDDFKEYRILEFIEHKGKICLLKLHGISDRDKVISLKGTEIFIEKNQAEKTRKDLGENSYYYYDLINCDVFLNGENIGIVKDIMEAGAGEILIIKRSDGREFMIPFVESMVDTKDIFKKKIHIDPVEGLIE